MRVVYAVFVVCGIGVLTFLGSASADRVSSDAPRSVASLGRPAEATFVVAVERDGVPIGVFTGMSGLGSRSEIVEIRDGTGGSAGLKLPGPTQFDDVTLKRGITAGAELWAWRKSVEDGTFTRSNVTITLYDQSNAPVGKWELTGAWPARWSGPEIKADGKELVLEEITLTYEGIQQTL